jgi:hypothetical protein
MHLKKKPISASIVSKNSYKQWIDLSGKGLWSLKQVLPSSISDSLALAYGEVWLRRENPHLVCPTGSPEETSHWETTVEASYL